MFLVYLGTKNTVSGQALQNLHCVEITSDISRLPSLIPSALLAISADLCEKSPAVSGCGFPLSGVSDAQGCDCGLHPGGVAAAGARPEGPIQRCDAGDLQEPGLAG